jgi:putative membrane protein
MRRLPLALAALLIAGPALAQTNTTTPASPGTAGPTGSSNPAVNTPAATDRSASTTMVKASALEKGSNSFTEGQAKSRLEDAGLTNVTDLKKDDDGIWRGKASRSGKTVTVGLDYKGNIAAE